MRLHSEICGCGAGDSAHARDTGGPPPATSSSKPLSPMASCAAHTAPLSHSMALTPSTMHALNVSSPQQTAQVPVQHSAGPSRHAHSAMALNKQPEGHACWSINGVSLPTASAAPVLLSVLGSAASHGSAHAHCAGPAGTPGTAQHMHTAASLAPAASQHQQQVQQPPNALASSRPPVFLASLPGPQAPWLPQPHGLSANTENPDAQDIDRHPQYARHAQHTDGAATHVKSKPGRGQNQPPSRAALTAGGEVGCKINDEVARMRSKLLAGAPHAQLRMCSLLGSGGFGTVYLGAYSQPIRRFCLIAHMTRGSQQTSRLHCYQKGPMSALGTGMARKGLVSGSAL